MQVTSNFTLLEASAGVPVVYEAMLGWTQEAQRLAGWGTVHGDGSHFNRHLLECIKLWLLFTLLPEHLPLDGVLVDKSKKLGVRGWKKLFQEHLGDVHQVKARVLGVVGPTTPCGLALASLVTLKKELTFHAIACVLAKHPGVVPPPVPVAPPPSSEEGLPVP